jgi:hypothetical protein
MWYNKLQNKHKYIIGALFVVLIIIPAIVLAKGSMSKKPVGGKVIADKKGLSGAVVCDKLNGPFSIRAFNNAPSGLGEYYASELNTKDTRQGAFVLGLYDSVQDTSSCKNPVTGSPVAVYKIEPFGNTK